MANSKFGYVKEFEESSKCQSNTFMVVRIDGRGFTKFCSAHKFEKPNDIRGVNLMGVAARAVMEDQNDIILAYGQSDEYSFLFRKDSSLYQRRKDKIITIIVSLFTAHYILNFSNVFGDMKMQSIPIFDGRIVCFPSEQNLIDYFNWRQCDTHVNNLYNTIFWMLINKGGRTNEKAMQELTGTFSKDKNEMLFSQFGINYAKEPEIYRRGSILIRELVHDEEKLKKFNKLKEEKPELKVSEPKKKLTLVEKYDDMIKGNFWEKYFPDIYKKL